MSRKWTEAEDRLLMWMRAQGSPRWAIANALKVSERAIEWRVAQIDPALRPWTLPDELSLMRMAKDGESFAQIADALGRSINSCRQKWMVLMGATPQEAKRSRRTRQERVEDGEVVVNTADCCERHLRAILAADPRGFAAWSEKRVGLRGVAPCHPLRWPLKDAA